jgi:hypothetical protein
VRGCASCGAACVYQQPRHIQLQYTIPLISTCKATRAPRPLQGAVVCICDSEINQLAPPLCNRPAQLSLVVYIDRSMLCIERWDGQRGRCCYASSALSRGLEPVCRRHCRYSIVHLASRSRPLVHRWQILTAKWYVFVRMSFDVCTRLVVSHTIDHAVDTATPRDLQKP